MIFGRRGRVRFGPSRSEAGAAAFWAAAFVAAAADRVVTMRDGRLTRDRTLDASRPVTLPFDPEPA